MAEAVEPDLVLARRHVAEGEARIRAQRKLIERLEDAGQPTDLAEQLLASLEAIMTQMRAHRDFLERNARGL